MHWMIIKATYESVQPRVLLDSQYCCKCQSSLPSPNTTMLPVRSLTSPFA